MIFSDPTLRARLIVHGFCSALEHQLSIIQTFIKGDRFHCMSTARMKLSIPRIFELQWLNVPLNVYTTLKILYRVEGGGGGGGGGRVGS